MSVEVVRAFVRLRQILASNRQLAARVDDLERKMTQSNTSHPKVLGEPVYTQYLTRDLGCAIGGALDVGIVRVALGLVLFG